MITNDQQLVYMNELQDFLRTIEAAAGSDAQEITQRVIHMMGDEIAQRAYIFAPKDTYELANSIKAIHGPMESRVVATAPHAVFVEFGTWSHNLINPQVGTYTIRPKKPGGVLRFTGKDGRIVYTKEVQHPGIPAQQFMARANAEVLEEFHDVIGDIAVNLVMR